MSRDELRAQLRTLTHAVFVVCRRHSPAFDGPFDDYPADSRPCPRLMAPLDIDTMVCDDDDWAALSAPARMSGHALANAASGHDWTFDDLREHHRDRIFVSLGEARSHCDDDTHLVIMPHDAVRVACTDALTGEFAYTAPYLARLMAWARTFHADATPPRFVPLHRAAAAEAMNRFKREALTLTLQRCVRNNPSIAGQ